jgi:NhaP-type Na+/H+ or K+/H+ antiporter
VFLINALLFLLIGMQLSHVLDGIGGGLSWSLVGQALAIGTTVIALRLVWMFVVPAVTNALRRGEGATPARPAARFALGWSGMRGGVSLALALAIPLTVPNGAAFPHRPLVVFLVYAAVLITLVPAGFTLGPLIDRLGLGQGAAHRHRVDEARARVLHAALEEIEALAGDARVDEDTAERMRTLYEGRLERLSERLQSDGASTTAIDAHATVRHTIITAERRRIAELRGEHAYPASVLRELAHELDLEESRLR